MAEGTTTTSVRLQVAGANERDVGKGTARLTSAAFEQLGLQQGQVIQITGNRTTAAVALPPFPEDEGLNIIRLDGLIRANANVSMGDMVEVSPADVSPATKVTLAPAQKNVRLMGSGQALLRTLFRRPVVAGDGVPTSVYRRTQDMDQNLFPEELFRRFYEQRAFGLQEIRLLVVSTAPRGIVQIMQDTEIELLPQYVEPDEPRTTDVTYDDIGGLGDTIEQVREMIELPLKHPVLFQRLGSIRQRESFCTGLLVPVRRFWLAPLRASPKPGSSTSPGRKSWAASTASLRNACARSSTRRRRTPPPSSLSMRLIPSRPKERRRPARWKGVSLRNSSH